MKIAIQGYSGAFHEVAARQYWPDADMEIVPFASFAAQVAAIEIGAAEAGIMAIENAIAGSILGNYQLLHRHQLEVCGEVMLPIRQNLLTLPGATVEQLREVWSHPMAIYQCEAFFAKHPHIKLVETCDTAWSAEQVRNMGDPRIGAIAGTLAAELFGLTILAAGIETNQENVTRFLVIKARQKSPEYRDCETKVSLCFELSHEVGSLHRVLEAFAVNRCNLTKIQSVPVPGKVWNYLFFADFVMEHPHVFDRVLDDVTHLTQHLRVFGRYSPAKEASPNHLIAHHKTMTL